MKIVISLLIFANLGFSEIAWKKIFNGVDGTGWHAAGASVWKVIPGDSAIEGKGNSLAYTMYYTDRDDFDQFTMKYSYRLLVGCSGFFFRSEETTGGAYVRGMQVEAKDGLREAGSIYCHECGGWKRQHSQQWSQMVLNSAEEYNDVILTVKEPNIYVNVNGHQAVGETDPSLLAAGAQQAWGYTGTQHINTPGKIGLQIHGGQPSMDIRFKNIEILQACMEGPNADQNLPEFVEGSNGKHPAVYEHNADLCGVSGCTDPAASNHNVAATSENGSCTYTGCAVANSANYFCTAHPSAFPCVGSNNYSLANVTGEECTASILNLENGGSSNATIKGNQLVILSENEPANFNVKVFNVSGDVVAKLTGTGQKQYELEVPTGLLFVTIQEGSNRYTRRLLSM